MTTDPREEEQDEEDQVRAIMEELQMVQDSQEDHDVG